MDLERERGAAIAAAQETIRQIERALAAKAAQIERLEEAVGQLDGNGAVPPHVQPTTYLAFVWTPRGYVLHDGLGDVPHVGSRVQVNGREYAVAKLARSPLPGDERRCAYLDPL